jgi:hypothetical protein
MAVIDAIDRLPRFSRSNSSLQTWCATRHPIVGQVRQRQASIVLALRSHERRLEMPLAHSMPK